MKPQTFLPLFSALFSLSSLAVALPPPHKTTTNSSIPQTIYEFGNDTWVENLAVRHNGKVLTTILSPLPQVWQIDPFTRTGELIYQFPDVTGVAGITEVEPDIFAVAVGNFSLETFKGTLGSYSIWSVDFSKKEVEVKKVTDMPDAQFLNGMTTLPTQEHTVLIADSFLGVMYHLDVVTGAYSVAIDNPDFKFNASDSIQLGINGIHYRDGFVYFTNTFLTPLIARIPVHANGSASGPVKPISSNFTTPDDFALDRHGNAWIATDPSNSLVKVTLDGEATVVVGGADETVLLGGTSAAFGRTVEDWEVLYVTSNGGLGNPPASGVQPGRLYAV
ncbi:uncharacterized protein LY89DRAFT_685725, partial [Mollisia scopiformis]